jgi:bifunctional ADP-heptose synthase (sugar kinase/adenylyltransferase)
MTPNLNELSKISGEKIKSSNSIVRAAKKLLVSYNMDFIIATRGADGLSIIGNDNYVEHIKPHIIDDPDVTGAGDTIIAVFSLVYTITKNVVQAATIANSAAASVVSQKGTTVVKFEDLERFL